MNTGDRMASGNQAGEQSVRTPILKVDSLSVSFRMYERGLRQQDLKVISNLSLDLYPSEILAVAGSSGSGKSLLAHAILGILPANATVGGEILWYGERLAGPVQARIRGKDLAFVPQSVAFLDPLMKVSRQVAGTAYPVGKAELAMASFGLGQDAMGMYPFQLSGGMARRVLLSPTALGNPKAVVADEPTPGLTTELAIEAIASLRALADNGAGILLITHDLDLAIAFADRIAVFYAGSTVETSLSRDWREGEGALRHPYSRALYRAMPKNGFSPSPGRQPYAGNLPEGCLFAPRCPHSDGQKCLSEVPESRDLRGGKVSCHYAT